MTETRSLRIGDAEREEAVAALGEHYAAGRITKDEYDERTGRVWAARFEADIDPLFADLPRNRSAEVTTAAPSQRRGPGFRRYPMVFVAPIALLAVAALVVLVVGSAPWLLFALFWIWMFGGFGFHRGARRGHRAAVGHWPDRCAVRR